MPRHTLDLTDEQKHTLCKLRDNGKPAYLRERAAAILKIGSGMSPHKVAMKSLLKKRKPDTFYSWLSRFRDQGIPGLFHKSGRGRKPAFAPKSARRRGRTSNHCGYVTRYPQWTSDALDTATDQGISAVAD